MWRKYHSKKSEPRFCASSNPAGGINAQVCVGEIL